MNIPEAFQRSPRYNKKNKKAIKVLKPRKRKIKSSKAR